MSYEPVTLYHLRCDGVLPHGRQCPELYQYTDPEDDSGDLITALLDKQEMSEAWAKTIRSDGWMVLRDGRVLCAKHVAGQANLAEAIAFGLPFDDPSPREAPGA